MTDLSLSPSSVRPRIDTVGLGVMVAAIIAISWSPIAVRFTDIGPAASALWRLIFALPILYAWAKAERLDVGSRERRGALTGEGLLACVAAGIAFAFDLAFFHAALPLTSVANASFISNLAPVVSVVAAFLMLGEKPRGFVLPALGIALLGVAIMTGALGSHVVMHPGDILATGAALSYAAYLVAVRTARLNRSAASVTLISSVVAAIILFVMAVADGGPLIPHTLQGWLAVIALGLVCHVLGQGLCAVGIGRLPAGLVALILLGQPLVSTLIAIFVFGEALTLSQAVGGAMILGAIVLSRR